MPNMQQIHLHSNGQLWTERTWNLIPAEIRELITSADISIDASRPETWLSINMVVQANNFEEMAGFVELGRRCHCDTVYLHRLVNWGTFNENEFAERAVHLPKHPRHRDFLAALQDEALKDDRVIIGNLTELRDQALAA